MWNELKSKNDIDIFMNEIISFHDTCVVELRYKSGTFVKEDRNMCMINKPYMYIIFHSQIANFLSFEMELGMLDKFSINLDLDRSLEVYDATFEKKDDGFYWYSDVYADDKSNYMFRCQTIRWRKIPLNN